MVSSALILAPTFSSTTCDSIVHQLKSALLFMLSVGVKVGWFQGCGYLHHPKISHFLQRTSL